MSRPSRSIADLPTPDKRPGASIVIFDGECRFCFAQVSRLHRWDRRERLSYLSLHDPVVKQRWPELTHEELMETMYVVTPGQEKYCGADSVRYLATQLPRLWPLRLLMSIPGTMPLWRWGYRKFANRRYLFGKRQTCHDGACKIP